jgi:hypothetical protein
MVKLGKLISRLAKWYGELERRLRMDRLNW